MSKVIISQGIFEELEALRLSSKVDMFDFAGVTGRLGALGATRALAWIEANPRSYSRLIFQGYSMGESNDTDTGVPGQTDVLSNHFKEDGNP